MPSVQKDFDFSNVIPKSEHGEWISITTTKHCHTLSAVNSKSKCNTILTWISQRKLELIVWWNHSEQLVVT